MDGVAVELWWRNTPTGVRPYVRPEPANVWCDCDWWPLTADAVALWTLRVRHGDRALCVKITH